MRRLHLGCSLLLTLAVGGCAASTEPKATAPGAPDEDGGAAPIELKEPVKIGDALAGGKVLSVTTARSSGGPCTQVVVEHEAAWRCSAEQIQEASNPYHGIPDAGPSTNLETVAPPLQVTDCKGLAALRRPELKRELSATLRSQRLQALQRCLPTRSVHSFDAEGKSVQFCAGRGFGGADAASSVPMPSTDAPEDREGASQYSTTNTQVAGVDEADFVKNDAQYVYVLSAAGLHVIDAWPAEETRELKRLALPGLGTRLFLHESRLVVYVRPDEPSTGGSTPAASQTCTYAYECEFGAEPGRTTVIVYDVSEPSAPTELTRYELSGGYIASRRVGSTVYTVVYDRPGAVAPFGATLDASDPVALEASYQAARVSADSTVDALEDAVFLPWVQQAQTAAGTRSKIDSCDEALAAKSASGLSLISVVTFDLNTLTAPHRTMIASMPGFVYASGTALYMATEGADGSDLGYYYAYRGPDEVSALHKFTLQPGGAHYVGTSTVRGHVLNQFAMDEHAGVLRVATSVGQVPDPNVSSNLTTFADQDGRFAKLGELTGLAPTEDIRSVRFDGTRGFVVTFKKTDPLYVIDLSDPARPAVLGELKIPGFSTYMHPLDQNHLLALGFEADDHGSFAYFNGIQIQIFDVAQLEQPKLLHKTVIGTRGSASDALTNHLAFNYFAAKSLLALPMTICDGGGDGSFGDKLSFSGLMLFDVSLTAGVTERGRLPFADPAQSASVASCSAWWTSTSSVVKRSIIMDDYAIAISDAAYKVARIADLSSPLATLPLTTTP